MAEMQHSLKVMQDFWNTAGPVRYFLLIIPAVMLISVFIAMVQGKSMGKKADQFKKAHPDASSILLKAGGTPVTPHAMYLHQVEGQELVREIEGTRYKYWLTPGEHIIHVSYEKSRPGVLHRTVTTTFGPIKMSVSLEANKSYVLQFIDDKFEISEI